MVALKHLGALATLALATAVLFLSFSSFFARSLYLDYLSGFRLFYLALCLPLVLATALWWGGSNREKRSRLALTGFLLTLIAAALNWISIRPFFQSPPPATIHPTTELRLLSFNLLHRNENHDEVIEFILEERPHVVALQEAVRKWTPALEALESEYPIRLSYPKQGLEIFSRVPVARHELQTIGKIRGHIHLELEGGLHLYAGHAYPWRAYGEEGFQLRNNQLERIAELDGRGKVVVIGDLNVSIWSRTYREMLKQSGLHDSRLGFGPLPTQAPFGSFCILGIPIDHCLVGEEIDVLDSRTGPALGSDHRPLIVDIAF